MTKVELVEKVTEATGLQKKDAERLWDIMIEAIQAALKNGEKVSLAGLGTFVVVDKKARMARNPKTGAQVSVPARKAAKFKAGKELKALLLG